MFSLLIVVVVALNRVSFVVPRRVQRIGGGKQRPVLLVNSLSCNQMDTVVERDFRQIQRHCAVRTLFLSLFLGKLEDLGS